MKRCLFLASLLFTTSQAAFADNLYDVYQGAVANDFAMRTASAQLRSQEETYYIARAQLLPQIGLSVSYGSSSTESTTDNSAGSTAADLISISDTMDTTVAIGLSQQVFNMNAWYTFKSSRSITEKAQLDFQRSQQSLIKRTIEAYLNVLRAHDNLTSSIAEEKAIKQQLDQTQQRFNVGLVALTEVHESQAAYDLARVARVTNEGNLEIAYELLSLMTGTKHGALNTLSEQYLIAKPDPIDIDQWTQWAMANNLDIKIAKKAYEAAQHAADAATAAHYPTISLSANIADIQNEGERYTLDDLEIETDTESIMLTMTVPLYSGGGVSAAKRKAVADSDIAKETYASVESSVTQRTRAQYIAVLTHVQKVEAHKRAIVSATSALEAVQAGYNVGNRAIVDVLNAQQLLFAAERDYANARYDYILAVIELKALIGQLTPADIITLNESMTVTQTL